MEPFVLVIMERGSEWPAEIRAGAESCIVLTQQAGETHEGLLRRTYDRIRAVERLGGRVERALLACNGETRREALEGRVPIARALVSTVRGSTSGGNLVLAGRADASARVRQSLVALAGAATGTLAGSAASVSVLFEPARRPLHRGHPHALPPHG
jgi:hypothetical protein